MSSVAAKYNSSSVFKYLLFLFLQIASLLFSHNSLYIALRYLLLCWHNLSRPNRNTMHLLNFMYSGVPLLWTPWGPGKVSCIERCPYFGGKFPLRMHIWDMAKCPEYTEVSLFQGCPLRGVPLYLFHFILPVMKSWFTLMASHNFNSMDVFTDVSCRDKKLYFKVHTISLIPSP